jgi:hypothetical protein
MASPLPTLALAVLYTVLFVASWEPDTFRLIMNPDFYFLPQVRAVLIRQVNAQCTTTVLVRIY